MADDQEGFEKIKGELAASPDLARLRASSEDGPWLDFFAGVSELLANNAADATTLRDGDIKDLEAKHLWDPAIQVHLYFVHAGSYPTDVSTRFEALLSRSPDPGRIAAMAVVLHPDRPDYMRALVRLRDSGPYTWADCEKTQFSRPYLQCEKAAFDRLASLTALEPAEKERLAMLDLGVPKTERAFCAAVRADEAAYRELQAAGANDLKLSKLRTHRGEQVVAAVPRGAAKAWVGTVTSLTTTGDGKAALAVQLACGVPVMTWNNGLSDVDGDTLISQSSPMYDVLADLATGAKIGFDGEFLRSDLDGFREASLTEAGSMTEPAFVMRFSAVQPVR